MACVRPLMRADSISISFASLTMPRLMNHRGESGTHRCRKIKITVGHEMAMYKYDQLDQKLATPGNNITPTDQNVSNNVVTTVRCFPPVMSWTKIKDIII